MTKTKSQKERAAAAAIKKAAELKTAKNTAKNKRKRDNKRAKKAAATGPSEVPEVLHHHAPQKDPAPQKEHAAAMQRAIDVLTKRISEQKTRQHEVIFLPEEQTPPRPITPTPAAVDLEE